MEHEGSGWAAGVVLVICGAIAYAASTGAFYVTGKQWFDSCWTAQHSQRQANSPEEAVSWGSCEKTASSAIFNAGFMFAEDRSEAITPPVRAIADVCPNGGTDLPLGGVAVLGVDLVQDEGGPRFRDRFTPARELIVRAFRRHWPNCPAGRVANHFPILIEKPGGEFGWNGRCAPCEAEKRARAVAGK